MTITDKKMTKKQPTTTNESKIALITGSSKRLGRQMIEQFHQLNYQVIIHCFNSKDSANQLAEQLNQQRPDSAKVISGDITDQSALQQIVADAINCYGRLDLLVNNASSFYPNDNNPPSMDKWNDLIGTNMKAPYALSCLCAPHLEVTNGNIINMVDIHARKPLKNHTIYCMAKAGLEMMVKSLACEFAPNIRVNGIAPGAILWPEQTLPEEQKQAIISQIALKRLGTAQDIANTAIFLASSPYITGQIIAVDGGRSLLGANFA